MSESNLKGDVSWLDLLESSRARVVMLASVLPRSYAVGRAAARRSEESGIPAWNLGIREFGETATDELFVALSSFRREVPSLDLVAESVAACRLAGPELARLGVAGAHTAPPRMQELGIRRRKVGGVEHEHLEFESRPILPQPLVDAGLGRVEVAHARILRHPGAPRPWVVFVHGAEQGGDLDLRSFRAKHLHETLGLNVAMPVLPQHGPRRDLMKSWPGFDLLGNVATMMRAVSDVRSVVGWIGEQDPVSITVAGMSLGGPVAALTAGLDPAVDAVCAMVPLLDAPATIAHHLDRAGRRGQKLALMLRDEGVRQCQSVVDPLALEPFAPEDGRLVIAALGDRITSVQSAQRLHARWGGPVHWHPGGHVGHLLAAASRRRSTTSWSRRRCGRRRRPQARRSSKTGIVAPRSAACAA